MLLGPQGFVHVLYRDTDKMQSVPECVRKDVNSMLHNLDVSTFIIGYL